MEGTAEATMRPKNPSRERGTCGGVGSETGGEGEMELGDAALERQAEDGVGVTLQCSLSSLNKAL